MTEIPEPNFLAEDQSVASLVTQLHDYFKNSYSYFKTERSALLSRLEAASTAEEEKALLQELREMDSELSIFGALSDALSIADRLLHARTVTNELGRESGVYKKHHEAKDPN